jgi:spore coat protein JB
MNTPSTPCRRTLRDLQAIDFSLVEVGLYLDAYPHSREALSYYHKLLEERARLLAERKAGNCPPITAMDCHSSSEWDWVNGPWPWEPEAN